jgi:hypothetical protein
MVMYAFHPWNGSKLNHLTNGALVQKHYRHVTGNILLTAIDNILHKHRHIIRFMGPQL